MGAGGGGGRVKVKAPKSSFLDILRTTRFMSPECHLILRLSLATLEIHEPEMASVMPPG